MVLLGSKCHSEVNQKARENFEVKNICVPKYGEVRIVSPERPFISDIFRPFSENTKALSRALRIAGDREVIGFRAPSLCTAAFFHIRDRPVRKGGLSVGLLPLIAAITVPIRDIEFLTLLRQNPHNSASRWPEIWLNMELQVLEPMVSLTLYALNSKTRAVQVPTQSVGPKPRSSP
jgi:hypothetical protein